MDLSNTYLGFELPHPLMLGASPIVDDLDAVRRFEDAGAAAIVMHSLFEEQLEDEEAGTWRAIERPAETFAEATSYFPSRESFRLGPEQYLEQIRRIREAVAVPVIASLNGSTASGWLDFARLIEQAGAQALELNVYYVATDPDETAAEVESRVIEVVRAVKAEVAMPIAVKLSPYYSSLARLARQIDALGADGLVLFNRFYQPDIDVEDLEVVPTLRLSDSSELLLRLRWLAILSGRVSASLAVTGGVHTHLDAIKAVMCGAHGVQLVSALLHEGPLLLTRLRHEMEVWLIEHEYVSLRQMQGSMGLSRCPDPAAFERGNYARILQTWRA